MVGARAAPSSSAGNCCSTSWKNRGKTARWRPWKPTWPCPAVPKACWPHLDPRGGGKSGGAGTPSSPANVMASSAQVVDTSNKDQLASFLLRTVELYSGGVKGRA